jgi:hypothetical protein
MRKASAGEVSSSGVKTALSGYELLNDPLLNKGAAFTEAERDAFDLHGLLPPNIGTLEEQASRRLQVLRSFDADLERYTFLRELQDTNETLFYAVLVDRRRAEPQARMPTRQGAVWLKNACILARLSLRRAGSPPSRSSA